MKWLVFVLFFAALVADTYIYRSFISLRFRSSAARVGYIVFAILTDGIALAAVTLYGISASMGPTGVVAAMCLVWIFFFTFVPKAFYTAGGLLDGLMRVVARRRTVIFRGLGLAFAAAVMVVMVCGATAGRTRLRVEQVEICSPRIPAAFDGYRIVQFSDLHIGTMLRPERQIARVVEAIAAAEGDMVVHTGDLVNIDHTELTPELMAILSRIAAPDGVWNVWGNHDLGFYIKDGSELTPRENLDMLSEKVRGAGWGILSDRSMWIRRGGDSILLTGVDYPRDPMLNSHNSTLAGVDIAAAFEGVEGDPFNVVLAHTPKLWDEITAWGRGDLTLSGHVHAMQTKLPLPGDKIWSPAQYMYDEWSGKYDSGASIKEGEKNSVLYINDGIGCVGYPMRIGARGEITVITFKRCE